MRALSSGIARRLLPLLTVVGAVTSAPALALRPYESTDADVAEAGQFELELGPIGRLREGSQKSIIAPAAIGNIGLTGGRELVIEGKLQWLKDSPPDVHSTNLIDAGVFLKQILRRGVLQDETGLSVATEYGLLLPTAHDEHGLGASLAGIVSNRSALGSLHLNTVLQYTREHEPSAFLGAILEGPHEWTVRPVMELTAEQTSGAPRGYSRLAGLIWRKQENLAFDIAVRSGSSAGQRINEIRAGLTWSFDIGRK